MSESPYKAHDEISQLLRQRASHQIDESDLIDALLAREAQASAKTAREARREAIGLIEAEAARYPTIVFREPDGTGEFSPDCYTAAGARLLAKNAIAEIAAITDPKAIDSNGDQMNEDRS